MIRRIRVDWVSRWSTTVEVDVPEGANTVEVDRIVEQAVSSADPRRGVEDVQDVDVESWVWLGEKPRHIDPPPPRLQWPPPDSCKIADGDHWWATDGVVAVRDDGTPPMFQCGRTSWREDVSLEMVHAVIADGLDDYRVPHEPPRFDARVADVLRCGTSIDVTVPRVAVVRRGGDVVAVVAKRVTGPWDDGVDEVEVVDGMVREVVQ